MLFNNTIFKEKPETNRRYAYNRNIVVWLCNYFCRGKVIMCSYSEWVSLGLSN